MLNAAYHSSGRQRFARARRLQASQPREPFVKGVASEVPDCRPDYRSVSDPPYDSGAKIDSDGETGTCNREGNQVESETSRIPAPFHRLLGRLLADPPLTSQRRRAQSPISCSLEVDVFGRWRGLWELQLVRGGKFDWKL